MCKVLSISSEANQSTVRKAKNILRALDHPLRRKILETINTTEGGKITVTALYVVLRLEQSVASQHLAILRKAGMVTTERDGKYIYYSVDPTRIFYTISKCEELAKVD